MKKVLLNFASGIGSYLIIAIMGIIIPRLVIVNLGSAANGLITSINQLLTYATLLEAGVGMASQQALYGPVARNDRNRINEIFSATRRYYNRTGILYFVVVLFLSLCYPVIIHSEFTYFETFSVVFLSGFSGVFGYFFGGKYRVLMAVEGKNYVASVIQTVTQILIYTAKILVLNSGGGVIALQFSLVLVNFIQAAIYYFYFHRNYGWVQTHVTPDFMAIAQSKSVLVHQISSLVFNSTDAITLSVLSNLKTVSLYTIYSMPFTVVDSLIKATNNSVSFFLGQSYNKGDPDFLKKMDAYETLNMLITFSAYTAVYCMLIPFIKLYTAGISDFNYINIELALPFTLIYLLSNGRESSSKVIIYAGHFRDTQMQTVIETSINIVVSVVGVLYFGIYGVLVGTIAALLYRTNDMIFYANRRILGRSPIRTYIRWGTNMALFCVIAYLVNIAGLEFENYVSFLGCGIIVLIVSGICYGLLACVVSRAESIYLLRIVKTYGRRRKKANGK